MVHKDNKEKKKTTKTTLVLTFHSLVATNEGVDPIQFAEQNNEYLAEPKNSDGCLVTFKLMDCKLHDDKKIEKCKKQNKELFETELSDKLDRYMHFTFRGFRFLVDTEERTVECNFAGLPSELISDKDEDGLYKLNVETSD